jgi:hypothetical protein
MTKITEYYNKDTYKFIYQQNGHIESNKFREACFNDHCAIVLKVNHIFENGKRITKGYSK